MWGHDVFSILFCMGDDFGFWHRAWRNWNSREKIFARIVWAIKKKDFSCIFLAYIMSLLQKYNFQILICYLLMMRKSSCHFQLVKWYASFLEMIEAEGLTHVLPGVKTIEEGSNSIKFFSFEVACEHFIRVSASQFMGNIRNWLQDFRDFTKGETRRNFCAPKIATNHTQLKAILSIC